MTNFLKQLPQHCVFLKINDFFILKLLMLGFETRTSGFGSDLSANCATPTAQYIYSLMRGSAICLESGVHYLGSIFNEAILVFVGCQHWSFFEKLLPSHLRTNVPPYVSTYEPKHVRTYAQTFENLFTGKSGGSTLNGFLIARNRILPRALSLSLEIGTAPKMHKLHHHHHHQWPIL